MRTRFETTAIRGFIRALIVSSGSIGLLAGLVAGLQAQTPHSKATDGKANRASQEEIKKNVDREWVKKAFVTDMMDHWLTASVMPSGFIQENLDRQWKPWGDQREAS